MAKEKAPDYGNIKTDYLKGGRENSIPKLAARYGIPQSTLEKQASRERWREHRQETGKIVARNLPGKIAQVIIDEAVERTREHLRLWGRLLAEVDTRLDEKDAIINPMTGIAMVDKNGRPVLTRHVKDAKHLNALADVLKKATEGERLALGLDKETSDPADDDDFNGSLFGEGVADDPEGDAG